MNRDWNSFFTAEDFSLGALIAPTLHPSSSPKIGEHLDKHVVDIANAILREKLKKAKRVKCRYTESRQPRVECWESPDPAEHVTHTALLIDEREIDA